MYNFNEDAIREAAYYIWKNNGCQQGTALSDWDAAINQLSCQAAFATKIKNSKNKSANCNNTTNTKKSSSSTKKSTSKTTTMKTVKSIVLNPISALKSASNLNYKTK